MILKLLKYDIRGIGKKLVPLYVLALVFALLTRLTFTQYIMTDSYTSSSIPIWAEMIMGLLMGLSWIMVGAVFVMTFFMLVGRYYQSIYGDEGYLTNTLPITKNQIIITKVLSFYLWYAIAVIVNVFCVIIMFFHSEFFIAAYHFFVREMWVELVSYFTPDYVIAGIIFFVAILLAPAVTALTIFTCTGIGAKFRHKIAMGIVAYMVVSFVVSSITQIALAVFFGEMISTDIFPVVGLSIYSLVISTLELVGFYFATRFLLDKHLNLE